MAETKDGRLARGEERRLRLLDSAVSVVGISGSAALTHRAVAAGAGVSVASVTYHFPSIGDLRTATFRHAGSRVGLAFRDIVDSVADEEVPEIAAEYAVALAGARRSETVAVFDMIVAATHDDSLRPLVRFFNERLAALLLAYTGDRFRALVAASAIQGLVLGYVSQDEVDDPRALHDAVAGLVRRYGAEIAEPGASTHSP